MPDLFDFAQALMGRPDPRQQLYAALGQGPGQPGSSQGPQPLAGQNAPPGGPAGPGGSPDPSGGPSQPQQPPQPQAYQSPPDLAQAYMALSQQNQAREGFWSGLSGVAAALHPGRVTPAMMKAIAGPQGQDPGTMFQNLMQLQQYQQQNQALQAYRQGVPGMLKGMGLSDDEIKAYTPLALADPSFATKIAENQLGVGGGPAWMAQKHAEKALTDAGKPIPWTQGDPASYSAWTAANTGQAVTTAKTKADDLVADQHNFAPALGNYDKAIGLVDQFMTPEMQKGAQEFLGTGGSIRPVASMDGPGKAAWALYKQIMATQFSAGTQDFKGAGRITQQELTQDAPSQSTMGQLNQDPNDFFAGVAKYRDQLAQHRGNLFGAAQKGDDPRLSDEDYTKYVAPNIDLFGGPKRTVAAPADSGGGALKPMPDATKSAAQALIAKDPSQRGPLIQHLREQGIDPSGL